MKPHRPIFYRYQAAFAGHRVGWNRYGLRLIGAVVHWGSWAYCVKWASV